MVLEALLALSLLAAAPATASLSPAAPRGHNVHLVSEQDGRRLWRGAAPTKATLDDLQASAGGLPVTLIDLRSPSQRYDQTGEGSRLTSAREKAEATRRGWTYLKISAMDRNLPEVVKKAAERGHVYYHCMYGVNRAGFLTGRLSRAWESPLSQKGLGSRDFRSGVDFEKRIQASPPRRS